MWRNKAAVVGASDDLILLHQEVHKLNNKETCNRWCGPHRALNSGVSLGSYEDTDTN